MDEDNCQTARIALGNVTNQLGKRTFSMFSSGLKEGFVGIEDKNKGKNILVNEQGGVKRACVLPLASSEINSLKENVIAGISKAIGTLKESKNIDFAQDEVNDDLVTSTIGPVMLDYKKSDVFPVNSAHPQDGIKLNEISTSMVSKGSNDNAGLIVEVSSGGDDTGTSDEACDMSGDYCEILEHDDSPIDECDDKEKILDPDHEVLVSRENVHSEIDLLADENDRHGVDDLVQSQTGSVDHNKLPLSQESRCFGLERCTNLNRGDVSNTNATIEMIKTCTCSFCTKAAYIWTDLHYQDFMGRVATIKKSEKEASLLAERSSRSMETEKHGNTPQVSTGVPTLESQLMGQWRSLFSQMQKIYEHEGNHLEARLHSLKDLREKCKVDLEFRIRPDS